jgi:hypothetical protein
VSGNELEPWPPVRYEVSKDTLHLVHMWTQIVGKVRLALTPLVNHWWNSTLTVTPRGLTTGVVPSGGGAFAIDFDFVAHELSIVTSDGGGAAIPMRSMSVAQFYGEVLDSLAGLGVPDPHINLVPNEVAVAVPFPEDVEIRPYDRDLARQFAETLLKSHVVFERFRAGFLGKASPVQFFWGSFDLASARFSGKRAPAYAGGKPPNVDIHVMHEAYSHELIAAGFWPGTTTCRNRSTTPTRCPRPLAWRPRRFALTQRVGRPSVESSCCRTRRSERRPIPRRRSLISCRARTMPPRISAAGIACCSKSPCSVIASRSPPECGGPADHVWSKLARPRTS